jgi:hypothetical protein
MFEEHSAGKNGPNWSASAKTICDWEADKSGEIIYAEGTLTCRRNKIIVSSHAIDNRCCTIVDGKPKFKKGATIYKQADWKNCLWHVLTQLITIGMQHN